MNKGRSRWGFSVSERRALLFIITASLVGWGFRLYQRSSTIDALPITAQDSTSIESIRTAYIESSKEYLGTPSTDAHSDSAIQRRSDEIVSSVILDINRASLAELENLPGIGSVLANRIVEERNRRGGFKRIEEILEISGIGDKRFKKIRPLICCNPPN